jgi:hypothetical protein
MCVAVACNNPWEPIEMARREEIEPTATRTLNLHGTKLPEIEYLEEEDSGIGAHHMVSEVFLEEGARHDLSSQAYLQICANHCLVFSAGPSPPNQAEKDITYLGATVLPTPPSSTD